MLSPHDAVGLALDTARAGLANSEMPIGAIVFDDERILGSSYTRSPAAQPTRGTASKLLNRTYGASGSSCKDGSVAEVARLMTFVDADDEVPDARQISVLARHQAVLDDGRRVLLMDDRGWSESGPPNIWVETSVQDIVDTMRAVVGPDEPFGGCSHQDLEADHWAQLAGVLGGHGIAADARA